MLIDYAKIHAVAGKGGAGCISFRREKYVPKGGPDGGDGGRGGSVLLAVDPHVRTLLDCREQPRYRADSGRAGQGSNKTGRDGVDLVVRVPAGTVVRDAESGELLADLTKPGDQWLAARGGRGGRGNSRFATATNQAPRRADPGEAGEERTLELELKLIADVGLVGLPNAGKSTLLSRITRARPKIADYPFTTLEPNLGISALDAERTFVVADIPGLIEGASEGRGLGLQFLRHVERTRVLAFLVDAASEDPASVLAMLEKEISQYSATLGEKPRVVVLSKSDTLPPEERDGRGTVVGLPQAHVISAHTGDGLKELLEELWRVIAAESAAETHRENEDVG
ncbi:MAG: GTPase ObgE [Candidatus Eisenbacteria bacterium]|uniref:GTPase Obg n=1 Tax=Eiseniibacteriota bacterium TaxID=2212470 RepID=A0A933W8C5_UNCEI|nr:GTPase ObgE [Candidatus Eisenbacteria bacterium]